MGAAEQLFDLVESTRDLGSFDPKVSSAPPAPAPHSALRALADELERLRAEQGKALAFRRLFLRLVDRRTPLNERRRALSTLLELCQEA